MYHIFIFHTLRTNHGGKNSSQVPSNGDPEPANPDSSLIGTKKDKLPLSQSHATYISFMREETLAAMGIFCDRP